jgi:hypothetical protein
MLPPIVPSDKVAEEPDAARAHALVTQLEHDMMEAQDNLLAAKSAQASNVNRHRSMNLIFQEGDRVMLATKHRRREYIQKGDNRVAKFMPRYDSPS